MSVFIRPVQRLKQVESTLQNNFVNTRKLWKDTAALNNEPITPELAKEWEHVLKLVAPDLYRFGRDLLDMQLYLSTTMYGLMRTRRFLWVVQAIMTIVFMIMALIIMQKANANNRLQSSVGIGMVVAIGIALMGMLAFAIAGLNESYRKLKDSHESPLFSRLAFLNSVLGVDYIVIYSYAMGSGSNVKNVLNEYKKYNMDTDELRSKKCGTDDTIIGCNKKIDECRPLLSLVDELKSYCTPKLTQIAYYLHLLKSNGSMHVNQVVLWKAVDVGIKAMNRLSFMNLNDMPPVLNKESINKVIADDIAPVLSLNTIYIERSFTLSVPLDDLKKDFEVEEFVHPEMAYRMLEQSPTKIGMMYLMHDDNSTVIYASPDKASALWNLIKPSKESKGSGSVVMARTAPQGKKYVKDTDVWSKTMALHSDYMIIKLSMVCRRFRYVFDLRSYRAVIDSLLLSHYGEPIYESAVSSHVTTVLLNANVKNKEGKKDLNSQKRLYVDAEQLIERMNDMSPVDRREMDTEMHTMHEAAMNHMAYFPSYKPTIVQNGSRIASIASIMAIFVMTCALVLGRILLVVRPKSIAAEFTHNTKTPKKVTGPVPYVITLISIMVIASFIIESMCKKRHANANHNSHANDVNTDMLTKNIVMMHKSYFALRELITHKANVQEQFVAASNLLNDIAATNILYGKCNTYTTAHRSLPAPVTELIMYVIIGGLVGGFGAYSILSLKPMTMVRNMRYIRGLKSRLIAGDMSVMRDASNIVLCIRNYDQSMFNKVMVWFGTLMIAVTSIWFAVASDDYNNVYVLSLINKEDCAI